MTRSKNSEKSVEELEDKLTAINDQLQKLMDGMMIINEHNVQTDKELLELKEYMGAMNQKGKEKEQVRAESTNGRAGSMEIQQEGRIRDVYQGATANGNFFTRYSKLEFPRFSGHDLKNWLYKVDQFFSMDEVAFDQRVKVASIHFDGEAIAWHRSYANSRNSVLEPTWTEYVLALNERFGEGFEDHMEALKILQQMGSVKGYQAEFDRLLTGVNLSNENAISYFLGGLKPELNKAVRIQSPRTLLQAYRIARLQEEVFEAQAQSWGLKPIMRTNIGILPIPNHNKLQYNQKNLLPNSTNKKPFEPNLTKNTRIPGRRLSTTEMDERRTKGLYFFCDDKYVPGHKCKGNKQLYLVEVTEDEEVEVEEPEDMTQELLVDSNEFMAISLQAFTCATGYQTIRVTGYHKKRPLQVLIDTGSTHNFMVEEVASRLGCKAYIVLGVQWLNTLGRILFDFKKRTIEFMYQGKKHVLRGANEQLKAAKAKSLVRKEGVDAQFFMMSLVARRDEHTYCHSIQATPRADPLPDLTALIKQYACIFELPTTLPPRRGSYDHRIPLKEAFNPVNKRPYRYPGIKKDIIEKLVQKMLDQGVIQHSTSPYASPVVLVGKKDGSWRLCVDYRSLNQNDYQR
ncbi:PREDICTED: uncharacterized protein LOC109240744 [Nicotiana attenuata]|uniref:uncharacterized protein LOC109240744 n=1 Tax=Nicotiana attenuata TaxID=49451 RepID=UPI0009052827|nr:PREDICTED: uncharacterized protein LOC109240744 [Nicotiana attenuata]